MSKRYCLQKLRDYNERTREETWVHTERRSDNLEALTLFMTHGSRIVDKHNNDREVRRNFDPDNW